MTQLTITIGSADAERMYRMAKHHDYTFSIAVHESGAWELTAHNQDGKDVGRDIGKPNGTGFAAALMHMLDQADESAEAEDNAAIVNLDERVGPAVARGAIQPGMRVRCIFTDEQWTVKTINTDRYAHGYDDNNILCYGYVDSLEPITIAPLSGTVAESCVECGGSMTHQRGCSIGRRESKPRYRAIGNCTIAPTIQHNLIDGTIICQHCEQRKDHHVDLSTFQAWQRKEPCLLPANECDCSKEHEQPAYMCELLPQMIQYRHDARDICRNCGAIKGLHVRLDQFQSV